DEKSVRSIVERREAHALSARAAEREPRTIHLPSRLTRNEVGNLPRPFLVEQRAGDVDDPTARLDETGGEVEQVTLKREEARKRRVVQPPAGLGIAPPGSGARARGVDQHRI